MTRRPLPDAADRARRRDSSLLLGSYRIAYRRDPKLPMLKRIAGFITSWPVVVGLVAATIWTSWLLFTAPKLH